MDEALAGAGASRHGREDPAVENWKVVK